MPVDEEGYNAIQVMTDVYSKLPVIEAIKDKTAKTTADVLINGWIKHNGMPLRVHSERARAIIVPIINIISE